jgi:serine/threonine-protein kinase
VNFDIEPLLPTHYHLLELLYAAPNRKVYLGRDKKNQTLIIIKCFAMSLENAYLREAAAAFGVRHSNIANCLDTLYLGNGYGCLIYEYISGGNLRTLLKENKPLKLKIFFYCLRDILRALQQMHKMGMIHCDIKPENILLRPQKQQDIPQFVLSDLGAAAFVKEAQSGKMLPASPAYIAPERLYEKFSFSSDLYSVGILGFEMLVGQRPFQGTNEEIFSAHLSKQPPLEMISNLQLREYIGQLLEKNPEQRLGNADLALKMLFNIAQGKAAVEKPSIDVPEMVETPPNITLKTEQLKHHRTLFFKQPVQQIVSLGKWLGICFEHHWEIFEEQTPIFTLFNTFSIQSNGHYLIYSNQDKIYRLNIENRQRSCLYADCHGLKAFDNRGQFLVWSTGQRGFSVDLSKQTESYYQTDNYMLEPKICILSNGDFATNEGYMGHRVTLRNAAAQILQQWELSGPVLNLHSDQQTILVLALDVKEQARYNLYCLEQHKPLTFLELPSDLIYSCCISGRFVGLMSNGELFWSDKQLQIHSAGILADYKHIDQFHLSADFKWFVTLQTHKPHSTINIWEQKL